MLTIFATIAVLSIVSAFALARPAHALSSGLLGLAFAVTSLVLLTTNAAITLLFAVAITALIIPLAHTAIQRIRAA